MTSSQSGIAGSGFSRRFLVAVIALLGTATHVGAQAPGRTVAITFDDLPFVSSDASLALDPGAARDANAAILNALDRHNAPATGFVVEQLAQGLGETSLEILADWNVGPYELGNHSLSHADINTLTPEEIRREIVGGATTIEPMARAVGRSVRFYRFPQNHIGDTEDKRQAIDALLAEFGYAPAASTIDTSDYLFSRAYDRALKLQDDGMRQRIENAYIDHSRIQIAYYATLNAQALGYEPPAIMLLHLNRLNAETMDRLLALFEQAGYAFVSLSEAQSDPAYSRPPAGANRFCPMWGYRWARERGIRIDGRLEQEPPEWISVYGAGVD